jgi:hypothetical protein
MENVQQVMVKMAMDSWNGYLKRTDALFKELGDEQLQKEVSPGRNTGVYLLGHLVAVHDAMIALLGLGGSKYPELEMPFIKSPDKSGLPIPAISELRNYWNETNQQIAKQFAALTPGEWFMKHTAVTEEDFAKEPHRNRLNVLLSRTSHLASHYGQLVFLKS